MFKLWFTILVVWVICVVCGLLCCFVDFGLWGFCCCDALFTWVLLRWLHCLVVCLLFIWFGFVNLL